MENEIMETEEVMDHGVYAWGDEPEDSKMSTGVAMLIGAGLTAATVAVVKLGKRLIAKVKDHRELRQPDEDDFVEVTDEDIENVTK